MHTMKALTLAVVLLSSVASLAQTAPRTEGAANAAAAEMRRPPPPGHSTPRPPQPVPPPPPVRNLAVIDREVMERRIDKLENALRDAMSRTRDNQGRNSIRAAMEELDKLSEYVDDAAPYGTGLPPPPGNYPGPGPQPMPVPLPVVRPITDTEFRSLTQAMARESFPRDKMRVLSMVVPREHFLVSHVMTVINQFSFSNDKLEVVRVMRPSLLDSNNSYELFQAFPFSADKQKLQEILDGRY
ncbi:MAG: DUF4476 domain-containing protein [Myxococcaceae bacterium]|nr:MAG: DUF4476 domain-containing protein [Myxococcaceae bacterium]